VEAKEGIFISENKPVISPNLTNSAEIIEDTKKVDLTEPLEYNIYTNVYGIQLQFCGFETSLYSVLPDSCIVLDFEKHISKGHLFHRVSQKDRTKIEGMKLLLLHRGFITRNIKQPPVGVNRYNGPYIQATRTLGIPNFQYHY
jgi:hypothetical protein